MNIPTTLACAIYDNKDYAQEYIKPQQSILLTYDYVIKRLINRLITKVSKEHLDIE